MSTDVSSKRRIARALGSLVFVVEVIALVAITVVNATGNADTILKLFPPAFLTPVALLTYMLVAALLIKYGSGDDQRIDGVVYRENMKHRQRIEELEQQLASLRTEKPRGLTDEQPLRISRRAKRWTDMHSTPSNLPWIHILATPKAADAKSYAGQIRLALEAGGVYSDEITDFRFGNAVDNREEWRDENAKFLSLHDANVTIFGNDDNHDDREPLHLMLADALLAAGIDTILQEGPNQIGGRVAIVIGTAAKPITTTVATLQKRVHELERNNRRRTLSEAQKNVISRITKAGLEKLRMELLAAGWPAEDANSPLAVHLVSIGDDREIIAYRRDYEEAFKAGGFEVSLSEWPTGGTPEYEAFVGQITVLQGKPENVVRPFVLEALHAAKLEPRESDFLPPAQGHITQHGSIAQVGAIVVIGQRR